MKLCHFVFGVALIGVGTAVSLAADSTTPATASTATTQSTPATPAADAQTPATPATPATGGTPAATPDPNEKICKKDETTGSRLSRVCKTRKEWEDEKKSGGSDF